MSEQFYGGQAVIEGVMMRGKKSMAVAVRNQQDEIVLHEEPLTAKIYTASWGKWPFVRGLSLLWDALGLGIRSLMWSADVAIQEEGEEKIEFTGPVAWGTVATSLSFAIVVFFLLPNVASRWVAGFANDSVVIDAVIEGVLRMVLFLAYLWAIGFIPDIRRVFGYHGAEHKTINAYEAGDPLTVENVQKHSVQHTRCGTSFLLYVMVISIILFAPLTFAWIEQTWLALLLRFATRLLLIPIVAGIAYEIIRFSARHEDNKFISLLIQPGLLLQKMTTREPEDGMVEVAIKALQPVLGADGIVLPVFDTKPSADDLNAMPNPAT